MSDKNFVRVEIRDGQVFHVYAVPSGVGGKRPSRKEVLMLRDMGCYGRGGSIGGANGTGKSAR